MRYFIFHYGEETYDCDTEEEMKKYLSRNISSDDDAENYSVTIGERFDVKRTFHGKKLVLSSDPYIKAKYNLIHIPTGYICGVGTSGAELAKEVPIQEASNYKIERIETEVLAEVDDNPTIELVKSDE